MDRDADHPFPWFTSNDPVPAVSPTDLRSMWAMERPAANASGQSTATDIRLFEHVCSPGADVQAVLYRVWMLWMLVGPMNMLSPWLRDVIVKNNTDRYVQDFGVTWSPRR